MARPARWTAAERWAATGLILGPVATPGHILSVSAGGAAFNLAVVAVNAAALKGDIHRALTRVVERQGPGGGR